MTWSNGGVRVLAAWVVWCGLILGCGLAVDSWIDLSLWLFPVSLPVGAALSVTAHPWRVVAGFWATAAAIVLALPDPQRGYLLALLVVQVIEAAVGLVSIRRIAGVDCLVRGPRELGRLVLAVGLTSLISLVSVAVAFAVVVPALPWWYALPVALARLVGLLTALPLFLPVHPPASTSRWEFALQIACALVLSVSLAIPEDLPIHVVLVIPLMLWMALRSSYRRMMVVALACFTTATVLATSDVEVGSYIDHEFTVTSPWQLIWLQILMLVAVGSGASLASVVTRLRIRTREVAAAHDRWQRLFHSPTGVLVLSLDAGGRVVRFGRGGEELLGYSQADLVGGRQSLWATADRPEEGPPDPDADPARIGMELGVMLVARLLQSRTEEYQQVVLVRDRWGEWRRLVAVVSTVPGAGPEEYLITACESREPGPDAVSARDRQQAATLQATALTHAKREFLSTLTHELRTPVTTIVGYSELLMDLDRNGRSPAEQRMLGAVDRGGRHLLRLVDSVLEVAELTDRCLDETARSMPVGDLVADAVAGFEEALRERGQRVDSQGEGLACQVLGGGERLERIVARLVEDASRVSPVGATVRIEAHPRAQWVDIEVIDRGGPVDPADLPRLFDRFYDPDGSADRSSGSPRAAGAGLFLSREAARMHGGDLFAASQDEGMVLTLRLPRVVVGAAPHATAPQPSPQNAGIGRVASPFPDRIRRMPVEGGGGVGRSLTAGLVS